MKIDNSRYLLKPAGYQPTRKPVICLTDMQKFFKKITHGSGALNDASNDLIRIGLVA